MTKKEDIVYAALELAAEYGLKAISMSQIAGKVGLTKSSLYSHFKSKEELINAVNLNKEQALEYIKNHT